MNETERRNTAEAPGEAPGEASEGMATEALPPPGSATLLYGFAGCVVIAMIAAIGAYGVWGETITAGLDRACSDAAFHRGKQLEAAGNLDAAIQQLRQAMEAGQFLSQEQRFICGRSIGELLSRQDRYAEAIAAYEALPEAAFSEAGHYAGYVTSLWHGGETARAQAVGEEWLAAAQAAEMPEQQIWARNALMRLAEARGDTAAAQAHAEAMIALNPRSEARLVLANLLHGQGKNEEALAQIEAFLAQASDARLIQDAEALKAAIANSGG